MAVTRNNAQRVLDKSEAELVEQTRHPALAGLADADLKAPDRPVARTARPRQRHRQ